MQNILNINTMYKTMFKTRKNDISWEFTSNRF